MNALVPGGSLPIDKRTGLIDWEALSEQERRSKLPHLPQIFYDSGRRCFWTQNARTEWVEVNEAGARRMLKAGGLKVDPPTGKTMSQVEEALLRITMEHDVIFAGGLAGYSKGPVTIGNQRVLVTCEPRLPAISRKTRFPVLERLLEQMFGDQLEYLLGWLQWARRCLVSQIFAPGQLLALAGRAGSGKSLLQNLITEFLGGRSAKPYRYMTGATTFNSELFGAEHLMIEDEAASSDIRTRRIFGSNIKNFLVNRMQSFHAKGRDAITLSVFWRMSLSVNDEPENLMVLPPLDESLRDKIMLLKVTRPKLLPDARPAVQQKFWEGLVQELAPFSAWLEKWRIPKKLVDPRFGILAWQHPDLLHAVESLAPEYKLLALAENLLLTPARLDFWTGTAEELERALRKEDPNGQVERLFSFNTACGVYLGRLENRLPERVMKIGQQHHRAVWKVSADKST